MIGEEILCYHEDINLTKGASSDITVEKTLAALPALFK
jgi:hypothetical protein